MPFLAYLVAFIVTVFSVGLEWQALVEPAAPVRHVARAANELDVQPAPALADTEKVIASPRSGRPGSREAISPPPAAAVQAQSAPQDNAAAQAQNAPPQCDVAACASAYHTFREFDCTYQPLDGSRRLCTRGAAADARAESVVARCHIRSCAEAYSSFNPSDCTYQPLDGPRRLCEK